MSIKKTILKNTAWLTIGEIFTNAFSYIIIIVIARTIGDVGLGQYGFIFSILIFTFIFSDMGLSYLMIRNVSRDYKKAQKYFENILTLKLILGILSIIITFVVSFFINKDMIIIRILWIASIVNFIFSLNGFFKNFFNAFDNMRVGVTANWIERSVSMILGTYFLFTTNSLIYLIIALLCGKVFQFIFLFLRLRTKVKFRIGTNIKFMKKILMKGFPFFLTSFFVYIYFKIDTVMLSIMVGDQVTGWYNASYKIIEILSIIANILVNATIPSMSKLYKQNKKLLIALFNRLSRYLLMLIIPVIFGILILAEKLIYFIYGKSFLSATVSLQILISSTVFTFFNYLMGNLLNSIDKQKYFTIIASISAVFNIILNLILIPLYSYIGAAIATVLTEALSFILLKRYVNIHLTKIKFTLPILKIIIASIIMGLFVYKLRFLPIWIVVPIGIITYILALIIIKLEKEDKEIIKYFLTNIKLVRKLIK